MMRLKRPRLLVALVLMLLFLFIAGGVWWKTPIYPRTTLRLPAECHFMQFLPDGRSLITAGKGEHPWMGGPIRVWDVEQGVERFSVAREATKIDQLELSPDGKVVAVHEDEGGLRLWDAATGHELSAPRPRLKSKYWGRFAFSPDGRLLAIFEHDQWSKNDLIRLWDTRTNQLRGYIEGYAWKFSFSSDGKKAASLTRAIEEDGRVSTRLMFWRIQDDEAPSLVAERQFFGEAVTFSPDLDKVAFTVEPGKSTDIELWDMPEFVKRCSVPYEPLHAIEPSLRFGSDGRMLLVGSCWRDAAATLWDVSSTPKKIGIFDWDSVISQDGRWLLTPNENGVDLFDISVRQDGGTLSNGFDCGPPIRCGSIWHRYNASITLSPSSKTVAIGKLWQKRKASLLDNWLPHQINLFHSNPFGDGPFVRLWDIEAHENVLTVEDAKESLFSPDGTTLATLHYDNTMKLWSLPVRKPLGRILGVAIAVWLTPVLVLGLGIIVVRKLKRA
jgi:WD40 repeat protein